MKRRKLRLSDIATVCAVLGIFASLAVPSFLQMQARARVSRLLGYARSCRQELPGWISNALANHPAESDSAAWGGPEGKTVRDLLHDFARVYNDRFRHERAPGDEPLLVVEPTGTLPLYCRRDGRIHLVPFVDSALKTVGATVVVTGPNKKSGPQRDGILAVYDVKPRSLGGARSAHETEYLP